MPETDEVAGLYGVPLERFTAERNALAKRLRAEGKRDEAARVAKLRRPPLTAWALNQVARDNIQLIEDVLAAGAELRSAMQDALDGDASSLRPAQWSERSAVDALLSRAGDRLNAAGHPANEAAKQRMAASVRAAIVDDSAADLLRQGTLDTDREAPGFGLGTLSTPRAAAPRSAAPATLRDVPPAREQPKTPATTEAGEADKQADRAGEAQERQAREVQARLAELEAEADRLAGRAQRLQAAAEEARTQAEEAATAASAARQVADQFRSELE